MLIDNSKNDAVSERKRRTAYILYASILALLSTSIYLSLRLPIFSNTQATEYFSDYYSDIKFRYDEMNVSDLLPLMRRATVETISSNAKKYLSNQSIPRVNISIDFTSWQAIKAQRNEMLGKRFMDSEKTYHKAKIQFDGKAIPIKIRLKGGRSDHIDSPKRWSFRIKTRKGKSLFGMKIFSLQHPKTRGYHREAVFHQLAKRHQILSLKYFYVNVYINGENIGTMAVEEVPAKEMLERQKRKEGLLYKLSDRNIAPLYHAVTSSLIKDNPSRRDTIYKLPAESLYAGNYGNILRVYYNALNAPIQEITRKEDGESYQQQRPIAVGLLKGFLEGLIEPSKVIDSEKMGQYFGYLALWGNSHGASFRNIRYYFNPYSFKFEPIAHDSNAYSSQKIYLYPNRHDIRDHEVNRLMLRDPVILDAYIRSIGKLYSESMDGGFYEEMRDIESVPLSGLREEFWFLPELELGSMKTSIRAMADSIETGDFYEHTKELVNDANDPYPLVISENFHAPSVIDVSLIQKNGTSYLEVHNLFPLKAKITSLLVKIDGKVSPLEDHLLDSLPISIDAFYYNEYLTHNKIELKNVRPDSNVEISGTVQLKTQEHVSYPFVVRKSFPALSQHPLESRSVDQITSNYPFIQYQKDTHSFTIVEGRWMIPDFIIFPESANLNINPDTHLLFKKNAGFLIKGRIIAKGDKEHPIIFDASDSEPGHNWKGITVLHAKGVSLLDHVTILNTSAASYRGWNLTGGVNFYKADVDIRNSYIKNTVAEDALNIVYGKFSLDEVMVENTRSDGFDADYAVGSIENSKFSQVGGDAIDFSGSNVRVSTSYFSGVRDKAISVGENSNVELVDINVIGSGTGLAVKDGSTVSIQNGSFENIKYSTLMSYTKKSVYGVAILDANNIQYRNGEHALVAQGENRLTVDGKEIEPIKINIKKLYASGYMKK